MEPSRGMVTFVMTDLEGSTPIVRALGDRWPDLLARHDEIVRSAAKQYGGVEVKQLGDGFLLAFDDPAAALEAVADIHRGLADEAWPSGCALRARAGVHAGEAFTRGGDFVGLTVHHTARVMNLGHGGQTLVTAAVVDLLAAHTPPGLGFCALGPYEVRDFDEPVDLHQLTGPGLRARFPPLRGVPERRSNLPAPRTSFVGRGEQLAVAGETLSTAALLTICGPGGVGKTRLALELARTSLHGLRDGARLVELARVRDAALVEGAVSQALGLPAGADLVASLAHRELLVVLDNCEHIIDAAASTAAQLAMCPGVHVLATSRAPLEVDGEVVLRLGPLEPPEAQALFAMRSAPVAAAPDDTTVEQICRRLDGIPLAIELAAARLRVMPAATLARRLEAGIARLGGTRRGLDHRHRTLTSTIAWSHDLLTGPQQTVLRRVAVLPAPFGAQTARAIVNETDTEDHLWELADQSLLLTNDERFRALEVVREFGLERLSESGEAELVHQRHLAWATAVADEVETALRGTGRRAALSRAVDEWDNLRAPLSHTGHPPELLVRLATALAPVAIDTGRSNDVLLALDAAVGQVGDPGPHALMALARLEGERGHIARATVLAESGVGRLQGAALVDGLAYLAFRRHRAGDGPGAQRALTCARRAGSVDAHTRCHLDLVASEIAWTDGRLEAAVAGYEAACELARAEGAEHMLIATLANLAEALLHLGQPARAELLAYEARSLCHPEDRRAFRHTSMILGSAAAAQDRLDDAHVHFREMITPITAATPMVVAVGLENLAALWAEAGLAPEAGLALGAARPWRTRSGRPVRWDDERTIRRAQERAVEALGRAHVRELEQEGAGLSPRDLEELIGDVGDRLASSTPRARRARPPGLPL